MKNGSQRNDKVYLIYCDNGFGYDDREEWVESIHKTKESAERYMVVWKTYVQCKPKKDNFKNYNLYLEALFRWENGFPKKYSRVFEDYDIVEMGVKND